MHDLAIFFAGALLCNCIPHLTCGLSGTPFPTPFARPSGIGDSSPVVNFLWGALNLLAGAAILAHHPVAIGFHPDFAALIGGILVLGLFLSRHFGKVRADRDTQRRTVP